MAKRLAISRRAIIRLALLAGLLAAAGVLLPGGARRAHAEVSSKESCDLVGENHHGPLSATLEHAAFPERRLVVTAPAQASLSLLRVHVFENCRPVTFTLTPLPGSAQRSRYKLDYHSARPYGEREVELTVRVDGLDTHDIDYDAPAASRRQAAATTIHTRPATPSTGASHQPFLASRQALIAVPAGAGLLLAVALLLFVLPGRRRRDLRSRVDQFTPRTPAHPEPLLAAATPEQRLAATERMLTRLGWWESFSEDVELARTERTAVELVVMTAVVTGATAALSVLAGAPVLAVLALAGGPVALRAFVRHRLRRQRDLFSEQLSGFIDELSSSLRAGHGLVAALATSVRSSPEPSRGEWGKVVADETLGMSLDESMRSLARRMASDDVEQVALVANLHQRTGGNLAEVLDRVADGVRERIELRRQLRTLSAQARMSRWILTGLPVVLALAMVLMDRAYARPLFNTTGGFIALAVAASLLTAGSLVMRKLTDIEV